MKSLKVLLNKKSLYGYHTKNSKSFRFNRLSIFKNRQFEGELLLSHKVALAYRKQKSSNNLYQATTDNKNQHQKKQTQNSGRRNYNWKQNKFKVKNIGKVRLNFECFEE